MSADAPVKVGDVLADKFRVERIVAAGGMGVVVEATHLALQQRVALKFLLPHALADSSAVARFEREARAAARLKSKHVVRVSDVGTMDDGQPYMVMEFLEGHDLSETIRRGNVSVEVAVEYITQICDALAEAHKLGIVHRDLKPGNVFVTTDNNDEPLVKVLDFGISKFQNEPMALTSTAQIMGSPLYMSPEQLRASRDVDARSDMWAVGVILYELVTGKVPFVADNVMELAFKVLETTPAPVSDVRDDVPAHVIAAIDACLAKERDARVASVADFLSILLPGQSRKSLSGSGDVAVSSSKSGNQPSTSKSSQPAVGGVSGTDTSWDTAPNRNARGRGWLAGTLAIGAVVAVGGIAYVKANGSEHAGSTAREEPSAPRSLPDTKESSAPVAAAPSVTPSASTPPPTTTAAGTSVAASSASAVNSAAVRPPPIAKSSTPTASARAPAASASAPQCHVVSDGSDSDGNPKFKKVCDQ